MWVFKNTTEQWDGDTHQIGQKTYSGATRTPSSRPLVWVDVEPPKSLPSSKPKAIKQPRPPKPPRPKGATAWD
jgi:hypothetical protein